MNNGLHNKVPDLSFFGTQGPFLRLWKTTLRIKILDIFVGGKKQDSILRFQDLFFLIFFVKTTRKHKRNANKESIVDKFFFLKLTYCSQQV